MGSLRLDLGKIQNLEKIVLREVPADYTPGNAFISADLKTWIPVKIDKNLTTVNISMVVKQPFRYLKIESAPFKVAEIYGYKKRKTVSRVGWRVSNLFPQSTDVPKIAWKTTIQLKEAGKGSYLALSVPGKYENEKVFSIIRIGDKLIAPTDRSPSFIYNNWEHYETKAGNYTFYYPVTPEMLTHKMEVLTIGSQDGLQNIKPELWLTNHSKPFEEKTLILN